MSEYSNYFTINNIIALILGIIGLILIIRGIWINWTIDMIKSWAITNATVLSVMTKQLGNNIDNIYLTPKQINDEPYKFGRYIPKIIYSYTVNGTKYDSNSVIYPAVSSYGYDKVRSIVGNLKDGDTIEIYYNPKNPKKSYIITGKRDYSGLMIGIILVIIAVYLGYYRGHLKFNKKQSNDFLVTESNNPELNKKVFDFNRA